MSAFRRILMLISVLAMSIPALAPTLAQDGPRRIETTENADYFGFDLRTVRDIGLEQCEAACLDDVQCKAFTYNINAGWCFLKSDYNTINPFVGGDRVAGWSAAASRIWGERERPESCSFGPRHRFSERKPASSRDRTSRSQAAMPPVRGSFSTICVWARNRSSVRGDMDGVIRFYAMAAAADPG